ncbi:hypothetical protein F4821DRAFT_277708 [Hypoxylon rubiginosum]|uniref:Uncharacterized protein n=1 Tax=Hypoxylon rubiginosum TaxID=110542 RepID=A0ACC0D426_9PEZI|nr:hypothetical protein F4821DRAFT_277708 [Hypoxylon rubiginosum]
MPTSTEKRCAHCGKEGSKRCLGCLGAPEHQLGDAGETVYCSKDCQEKGRAKHKYRCKKLKKRIILFRVGRMLKATVLAYREVLFPINIKSVELRNGTLCFDYDTQAGPELVPFPEGLTDDKNLKEAALMINQCEAVPHLISPLARHFFPAFKPMALIRFDLDVIPVIPVQMSKELEWDPMHTILKVILKDESWALDLTGRQYGYPEYIQPWGQYLEKKWRKRGAASLQCIGPYRMADEMGDLDEVFRLTAARPGIWIFRNATDRFARRHFQAFAKSRFNELSAKELLRGTDEEFDKKVGEFAGEVKALMTKFMQNFEQIP